MKNKELIRRIRALTVAGLVATSALASNVTTMTVYAIDVAEGDTVDENNEPLGHNRGIIITNNDVVDHNHGTIITNNVVVIENRGGGTIDTNDGTVGDNHGTITTNNAAVSQELKYWYYRYQ